MFSNKIANWNIKETTFFYIKIFALLLSKLNLKLSKLPEIPARPLHTDTSKQGFQLFVTADYEKMPFFYASLGFKNW